MILLFLRVSRERLCKQPIHVSPATSPMGLEFQQLLRYRNDCLQMPNIMVAKGYFSDSTIKCYICSDLSARDSWERVHLNSPCSPWRQGQLYILPRSLALSAPFLSRRLALFASLGSR